MRCSVHCGGYLVITRKDLSWADAASETTHIGLKQSHQVLKLHLEPITMVKDCPKSVTKVSSRGECAEDWWAETTTIRFVGRSMASGPASFSKL